jgi:hypothetical protein
MLDLARQFGEADPESCKRHVDEFCEQNELDDTTRLEGNRLLRGDRCICPLCLAAITADELASRVEQAAGREVPDLTVTSANLFHIEDLRIGEFNHRIYNLGWGHYHCNTVARDMGIRRTLDWMREVLQRNRYRIVPPGG